MTSRSRSATAAGRSGTRRSMPACSSYDADYENSLHFSPAFRRYSDALAEQLVERHELAGKHVAEIGSGKGEFLALLCERGSCSGTGFDPSYGGEVGRPGGGSAHLRAGALWRPVGPRRRRPRLAAPRRRAPRGPGRRARARARGARRAARHRVRRDPGRRVPHRRGGHLGRDLSARDLPLRRRARRRPGAGRVSSGRLRLHVRRAVPLDGGRYSARPRAALERQRPRPGSSGWRRRW